MKFPNYLTRCFATPHQQGRSAFKKWLGACGVLLALSWLPVGAQAAPGTCTSSLGGSAPLILTVSGFTVNTDPTVPVGTVIGSRTASLGADNPSATFTCTASLNQYIFNGDGLLLGTVGAYTGVYASNIPGIGIQLTIGGVGTFPAVMAVDPATHYAGFPYSPNSQFTLTIKLIKTGPITAGGSISGEVGQFLFAGANLPQTQFESIRISTPIIVIPSVPACTVTSPLNIPVDVGSAAVSDFHGIGAPPSHTSPFSINLSCSGGTPGATTNMYMTLTDQTNPGNTSNVLSLGTGSSASGVGIQILKADNSIVSYGPDSSAAGNTNQWFVQNTGNGTVTIPLKAGLVQTNATINSGSVQAIATYTMSYQ